MSFFPQMAGSTFTKKQNMARLTYEDFSNLINDFVWSNLNKEITGDVLRQLIVNILQSVPEMKLLDGKTIEQAITELRNLSENGTIFAFSDQFIIEENTVKLNIKYITANEGEASGPGGDPVTDQSFTIKDTLTNILSWDPESKINLVLDEINGINTITALEIWSLIGTYMNAQPLSFNLSEVLLGSVNYGTAGYLYVSFDLRVNDTVMNATTLKKIGLSYNLNSGGGYYSLQDIKVGSEFTPLVFRIATSPFLNNPLLSIDLIFGDTPSSSKPSIPAGCVFEIKNIRIYKDVV